MAQLATLNRFEALRAAAEKRKNPSRAARRALALRIKAAAERARREAEDLWSLEAAFGTKQQ